MTIGAESSRLRDYLHFLLSHHEPLDLDRCISVSFYGKRVWICARCLGLVWGYTSTWFLLLSLSIFNYSLSLPLFVLLFIIGIFSSLSIVDWSLQTILHIESTNTRRIITGFSLGIGLRLSSLLESEFFILGIGIAILFLFQIVIILLGVRRIFPSVIKNHSSNKQWDLI